MTRSTLVGLLMLASLFLTLAAFAAPTKWMVTGYVQGRVGDRLDTQGSPTVSTFELRRAYMYVRGSVDEHVTGVLLLAMQPTTRVEHAYAEYANKPYMVRVGLVPIPFGYEIPLSSSRLITLERSQIVSDLMAKNAGTDIYFFDRGAFVYYLPGKGLNVSAALVNGMPVENSSAKEGAYTKDITEGKPIIARIGTTIPGGEAGVSYYGGNRIIPGATPLNRLNFYAIDVETNRGPFTLLLEAMAGNDGLAEKRGGYLTVAYRKNGSNCQPYLRYDMEDQNVDTPNNNFSRFTVGNNFYLNPSTKLTLEFEQIDAGTAFAPVQPDQRLTGQFQVIF